MTTFTTSVLKKGTRGRSHKWIRGSFIRAVW